MASNYINAQNNQQPPHKWHSLLSGLLSVIPASLQAQTHLQVLKPWSSLLRSNKLATILIFISIITTLLIWLKDTPVPLLLNWDIYEHQTLINLIKKGHISLLNSRVSDTFTVNGYTPIFHYVLAFLQSVLFVDSSKAPFFWYYIQILYFLSTIWLQGYLVYKLINNKTITLLTLLFGIFIFESFAAYTSLFLMPQTAASFLIIWGFILLHTKIKLGENVFDNKFLALMLVIFITHFIMGAIGLAILGFTYVFYTKKTPKLLRKITFFIFSHKNAFIYALITILGVILTFNQKFYLSPLGTQESIDFNLSLEEKLFHLGNWYGFLGYLLFPIGISYCLRKRELRYKLVALLSLIFLIIYFYPFPYTPKFFVIGRYFINIVLALGAYFFISRLYGKGLKYISITLLALSLVYIFYFNVRWYKNILPLDNRKTYSHTSIAELDAARFLKENYGYSEDVILVSDPGTQYILEAFSEVNTQGGAYMNEDTRQLLIGFNNEKSPMLNKTYLYNIQDKLLEKNPKKVLMVLSGRYFAWQSLDEKDKLKLSVNIWSPTKLTLRNNGVISQIASDPSFKEVYRNQELVILELN